MVWPKCKFRIQDAGLKRALHAARWNTGRQKLQKNSLSAHHVITLSGYIFATEACIDNRKQKLLNSNTHMSLQYRDLRPTSGWRRFVSLGHIANFNGFRVLAALLHGTLVVGVSQTFRRWTEGATCIWRGPLRGILAHILGFGSRPCDHYFRSVCLSVCLFVQSFSQPSLIRFPPN